MEQLEIRPSIRCNMALHLSADRTTFNYVQHLCDLYNNMVSLNKCDTTNYVNKRIHGCMGVCGKAKNIVHLFLPNVCARVPNELELLS